MKINKLLLLSALPALGLLSSCEEMDENYKQYKEQDIYSGKVLNLKSKIGFESAILYWENPQDQVSKGVEIVAIGNDTVLYTYDFATLTPNTPDVVIYKPDSIRINNLNQGTAYSMTVYTVDAYGNRSIDVSIPVMPLSQEAYDLIVPPICAGAIDDAGNTAVNFQGITSLAFNFAGTVKYKVFDGETLFKEGEVEGAGKAKTLVAAVPGLKPGKPYKVQFETSVLPLSGSTPIEDTVTLKSESNIYVSISAIKGIDYKMYADSVQVSFTQAKNELAKKIIVRSNGTVIKEIANTQDSEGGEFGLKLTENKKVKLEFVRVDENNNESDVVSKDVQSATQALVDGIDYPKFSIGKDVLGLMVLKADKFGDNSKFKTKGFKDGDKEYANVTLKIVDENGDEVFAERVIKFPAGDRTFDLSLASLDTEKTYTVSYSFECYPKANGKTSEDAFTIARSFKIEEGKIK